MPQFELNNKINLKHFESENCMNSRSQVVSSPSGIQSLDSARTRDK